MSDQCQPCTLRGNLAECEKQDCTYHDLWYVLELKKQIENLRKEMRAEIRAAAIEQRWADKAVANGEPYGTF